MKKPRIIARLDVKGNNVVKGIRFEGLRIMGDPQLLAKKYYEQGADELIYIDTVASLYGRNNLVDVVKKAASKTFIPMTVGGGIRSINDAKTLLESGADKIAINTGVVKNKDLIKKLASSIGSQALVISIEAKFINKNHWEVYIDNGREKTGIDVIEFSKKAEANGAGEILLTSMDKDGTKTGYDLDLLNIITKSVSIPVIASGGAGNLDHLYEAIKTGGASAVLVASIFHYGEFTIKEAKEYLKSKNVSIRL